MHKYETTRTSTWKNDQLQGTRYNGIVVRKRAGTRAPKRKRTLAHYMAAMGIEREGDRRPATLTLAVHSRSSGSGSGDYNSIVELRYYPLSSGAAQRFGARVPSSCASGVVSSLGKERPDQFVGTKPGRGQQLQARKVKETKHRVNNIQVCDPERGQRHSAKQYSVSRSTLPVPSH